MHLKGDYAIMEPKVEGKKMSILEQLKKLEDERAKLINGAKDEAFKKAEAAVADLNSLGFPYRLVEGEEKAGKKKVRQKGGICKICKFETEPPHDGRLKTHREQGDARKPLTEKQMAELGFKKK